MRSAPRSRLLALPLLCTAGLAVAAAPTAAAHEGHSHGSSDRGPFMVTLDPLNDSGATGTAMISFDGSGDLTVRVQASGLVPGQPHAQHLHGSSDRSKDFHCPTMAADADGDGVLTTAEGLPDYGDIFISLTTKGDTSKASGLAVDRFPVADDDGDVDYERTIPAGDLPRGTEAAIKNLHVVQHGIDRNGNGEYDTSLGASELDPALPQEATAPANCGMIAGSNVSMVPEGGVETGTGGTTGVEALPLFLVGGALVSAAGAAGLAARRRRSVSEQ